MSLTCGSCKREHDLEERPDTGVCGSCGGPLVQEGEKATGIMKHATEAIGRVLKDSVKKIAKARVSRVDDTLTQVLKGDPNITFKELKMRRKAH
jgi:hypothetical protein